MLAAWANRYDDNSPKKVLAMIMPRNSSGDSPIGSPALRSLSEVFSFHCGAPISVA